MDDEVPEKSDSPTFKKRLAFVCGHCNEELAVEQKDESFICEEVHDCFGERVGLVAQILNGDISTAREEIGIQVTDLD